METGGFLPSGVSELTFPGRSELTASPSRWRRVSLGWWTCIQTWHQSDGVFHGLMVNIFSGRPFMWIFMKSSYSSGTRNRGTSREFPRGTTQAPVTLLAAAEVHQHAHQGQGPPRDCGQEGWLVKALNWLARLIDQTSRQKDTESCVRTF